MEVLRRIGQHEILIDTHESCGISLEERTLAAIPRTDDTAAVSRKQILSALSSGDEYRPLSLHWELWDRCNFSCPFCYIVGHSFERPVRFVEIRPYLSDLIDQGLLFCTLTGGEALAHPDFGDIYAFLKTRGVIVEVFTNGYHIDQAVLDLFVQHRPYAIEVSIYSFDNEKMRSIYKAAVDNVADVVRQNVLRLKNLALPVTCKTFLNTFTADEHDQIARWCRSNSLEFMSSSEFTPAYDGADLSRFMLEDTDRHASEIVGAGDVNICFPCGTRNYGCAITPGFEITPCPSLRHRDCFFDLRQLGVPKALQELIAFIRRFQNSEIIEKRVSGILKCKTCIAHSTPVRDEMGQILFFEKT